MAEYRSIKNICFIKYTHTKTDHRKREPQTLVIREVMAKCYERRYFNMTSPTTCSSVHRLCKQLGEVETETSHKY